MRGYGRVPESVLVTVAALLVATSKGGDESGAVDDRPNVLFIAIDDLNDWAAGLSEYAEARTPNIDRLASRGVLFTNAHCAAPACNPSRVSVMTGLRPTTSGVYYNWQDWRECENLRNVATLPQHFREHGYHVLGGGKLYHAANLSEWGLAGYLDPKPWHDYFPSKSRQLADELAPQNVTVNGSNEFYKGRFDWAPLDVDDAQMGDGQVVTWAERQLSQRHDKPLFLAVGIYRPHIPWYTPRKWFDEHPVESVRLPQVEPDDLADVPETGQAMARRTWQEWLVENDKWHHAVQGYLASVSFADAMVGRLLRALDDGPHADTTVVVLWSDHGYHLGHKEHWEKFALWEQATHVPLIVAAPQVGTEDARCDRPASLLDLYPTLIELCELSPRENLEGRSLVPFLEDPNAPSDRAVVSTQGIGNHAVRSQHWRFILYADGSQELYDHRCDPREFANVANVPENRSVLDELRGWIPATNAALAPATKRRESETAAVETSN